MYSSPYLYYPPCTSVSSLIYTNPAPVYSYSTPAYVDTRPTYATTNSTGGDDNDTTPNYGLRSAAPPPGQPNSNLAETMWQRQKQQAAEQQTPDAAAQKAEADRSAQVDQLLARGDKAFEMGGYQAAHDEYVRALVVAGDDPRVRIALGLSEFARGGFADAGRTVRLGVNRSPQMPGKEMDIRKAYGVAGDFEKHRTALEGFLQQSPEQADAWFLLGFLRYYSGDVSGAVAAFGRYQSRPGADPAVAPFIGQVKRPS